MSVDGLNVVRLTGADKCAASHAADLHGELLATSPVARMGNPFMRDVYYGALVAADLAVAHVAYVDGEPAGFLTATNDPERFMSHGLLRRPWRTGWGLARALLSRPTRLAVLWETLTLNAARQAEDAAPTGELLSFGVREPYRRPTFIRSRGIRVGQALLDTAIAALKARGAQRARAIVDADNLPAQFFYRGAGWELGNPTVKGWAVPTCEFVRNL
jgi:ribosomal protein S18 acetylase RimI-like enzyme